MAYRWINRFLKGEDKPVTEPEFPKIEGKLLRAFPNELPPDEINTKIDESFVPLASESLPQSRPEYEKWRAHKLAELRRMAFRSVPEKFTTESGLKLNSREMGTGTLTSEPGIIIRWTFYPPHNPKPGQPSWLVVLGEDEPLGARPGWLNKAVGDAPVLLVLPRNSGATRWNDPAPFYVQRSLPLLGQTVDSGRLTDVLAASAQAFHADSGTKWHIAGSGRAGVLAAYAALLDPRLAEVFVVDPPASHRDGPIFLNVLRVVDVPEAFGMLAPRPLTIATAQTGAFDRTRSIYRAGGGDLKMLPLQ